MLHATPCPTCGTAHPPERRYCLHCGTLVGQRPVDVDEATALRDAEPPAPSGAAAGATSAGATTAAGTPPGLSGAAAGATTPPGAAGVPVWRRPLASVLTAGALAVGIVAGFLLNPHDDAAGRGPVTVGDAIAVATSTAVPAPTVATPDVTASTTAPPAATVPAAPAPAPKTTTKTPATPAPTPAPVTTTPAPAPVTPVTTPAKPQAKSKPKAKAKPKPKTPAPSTAATAARLPKVEHIWLVGIGAPLTPRDGSYLGDAILSRGTLLSHYTPAATDPLAGAEALVAGQPASAGAKTIGDQLASAGDSWRVYANGVTGCSDAPGADPFLAFPSVTSAPDCDSSVVDLSNLATDLKTDATTPAFSYISLDPSLDPSALDAQLQQVVEPIRHTEAFKQSGLIAIVPVASNPVAPTGALLLSPFAAGSTEVDTTLGPYALLRTFEDLLGVDHLGHADDANVQPLGTDVLSPDA